MEWIYEITALKYDGSGTTNLTWGAVYWLYYQIKTHI